MDFDDLFGRRSAEHATAHDVFTDRNAQQAAFAESLAAVRTASAEASLLPGPPRRNVLAFHGMGGIGKSALRGHLAARLVNGDFSPPKSDARAVVADFGALQDRDFESFLLHVRAELGSLGSWRAFDLAFAGYWEERHPGTPLTSLADGNSRLRKAGEIVGVGDQISAAVELVVASTPLAVFGIGRRLAEIGVRKVIDTVNERQLLANCPLFEKITTHANLDERVALLPHLLAWDLSQIQADRRQAGRAADVAIFLDTWEELRAASSGMGSLEDLFVRTAYLMPNVLFVVLGRDRLDWADEGRAATLSVATAAKWPGLAVGATGEPRQHLIDELSPEDCDAYLSAVRTVGGAPAISPELRITITQASEGLPFFLELSVTRFDTLTASGQQPVAADFDVPFERLVGRVITDLSSAERNLLCAAAVARSFDDGLLAALVPQAMPTDRAQFLRRPFVRNPTPGWITSRIHDRMREAILAMPETGPIAWSADQWRQARVDAATWITESLLTRIDAGDASPDDRAKGLILAADLVAQTGVVPKGLPLVVWRAQEAGARAALDEARRRLESAPGAASAALRVACEAALASLRGGIGLDADLVREAWGAAPSAELRDVLAIYLGDLLDTGADATGAEHAFRSVSAAVPAFRAEANRLEATLLHRRNRFVDAMEACRVLPEGTPAERVARDALEGRILYWSGRFEDAAGALDRAASAATELGLALWAGRARRHEYLARAWGGLPDDQELRERALAFNDAADSTRGVAQVEVAWALQEARAGETALARRRLDAAMARVADQRGAVITWHMSLVASVACAVLAREPDRALAAHAWLVEDWRRRDAGPLWPVVSATISGADLQGLPEPQWLPGTSRETWRAVLRRG